MTDHSPREKCGVFGIYSPEEEVARSTFFALYALQHRGQESAGISVSDGQTIQTHKAMGLVAQVFTEATLSPLVGNLAIGHNRYSTTGVSKLVNAQPLTLETLHGPFSLAHNGNLTNTSQLRRELLQKGAGFSSGSDTEVASRIIARGAKTSWEEGITHFMEVAEGSYSMTMLTRDAVYVIRDPWGVRPLSLGRFLDGGYCAASESCAIDTVGAELIREIKPGEVVRLDQDGATTVHHAPAPKPAHCLFEYVYLARPDSVIGGQVVYTVRVRSGRELAEQAPADADLVIGVPDSAIPAAIGYADKLGLKYGEGLIKNRYIGRTFIQPSEQLRQQGVSLKLNPLRHTLNGKRIVVVDDSIVRGTTSRALVQLIRQAGATEVHLRICSPPVKHPDFLGIDMATYPELIAHNRTVEQIAEDFQVDSLAFLSYDGLVRATRQDPDSVYGGYFTGEYPVKIDQETLDQAKQSRYASVATPVGVA